MPRQIPTGDQDGTQRTNTGKTPSGLFGMNQKHIAPVDILEMALGGFLKKSIKPPHEIGPHLF